MEGCLCGQEKRVVDKLGWFEVSVYVVWCRVEVVGELKNER